MKKLTIESIKRKNRIKKFFKMILLFPFKIILWILKILYKEFRNEPLWFSLFLFVFIYLFYSFYSQYQIKKEQENKKIFNSTKYYHKSE